jgi:hypothetical protein
VGTVEISPQRIEILLVCAQVLGIPTLISFLKKIRQSIAAAKILKEPPPAIPSAQPPPVVVAAVSAGPLPLLDYHHHHHLQPSAPPPRPPLNYWCRHQEHSLLLPYCLLSKGESLLCASLFNRKISNINSPTKNCVMIPVC